MNHEFQISFTQIFRKITFLGTDAFVYSQYTVFVFVFLHVLDDVWFSCYLNHTYKDEEKIHFRCIKLDFHECFTEFRFIDSVLNFSTHYRIIHCCICNESHLFNIFILRCICYLTRFNRNFLSDRNT